MNLGPRSGAARGALGLKSQKRPDSSCPQIVNQAALQHFFTHADMHLARAACFTSGLSENAMFRAQVLARVARGLMVSTL
jgi:hypothetical protein